MGLLDQINNLSGKLNQAKQFVAAAGKTVFPTELQNLIDYDAALQKKITEFIPNPNKTLCAKDLVFLRLGLMTHFTHLIQGGEPLPPAATKAVILAHPSYQTVKQNYQNLDQQVSALEEKHLGCVFGYQQPDGSIVKPDTSWSEEQHAQVRSQALHQTARCWLTSDKSQYVS